MLDKTWNHTTGNVVYWVGPGIPCWIRPESHNRQCCILGRTWNPITCMYTLYAVGWGGGGAVSASPTSCLSSLKRRGGGQGFSAYISKQVFIKTYQDYQYSEITQTLKV